MTIVLKRFKDIASAVMYAAEGSDLESVLERIAEVTREIARTKYAALGIPDGQGGLRYFKVSGMSPEAVKAMAHLPRGHGLLGAVMQKREAIRLEDMSQDPRSAGFCGNHPHMTSFLGVPIQVGGRLFGILYLCDKEDGSAFDDQDQWLVETMAGYAAVAIAGAELSAQHHRLRVLEERERIAMELHDGVIQSLYALGMHVELLRTGEALRNEDLKPIVDGLNEIIEDIRRYIMKLSAKGDKSQSMRQILQEMVARLYAPDLMKIEVHAPDERPPFAPAIFEGICLMVNEAISNAVRHSQANHILITCELMPRQLVIAVRDDGQGFELEETSQRLGLGLHNMKQRARLYGGDVFIDSQRGQGTTLTITIPTSLY